MKEVTNLAGSGGMGAGPLSLEGMTVEGMTGIEPTLSAWEFAPFDPIWCHTSGASHPRVTVRNH